MLDAFFVGLVCLQVFHFGGSNASDGCHYAARASSISLGVKPKLDSLEGFGKREISARTPKPIVEIAPFAFMALRKTVKYQFRVPAYADKISLEARPGETFCSVSWFF